MTRNPTIPLARARAATQLQKAAALRRDLCLGLLPRSTAIGAIRDCLRHARACTVAAQFLGGVA